MKGCAWSVWCETMIRFSFPLMAQSSSALRLTYASSRYSQSIRERSYCYSLFAASGNGQGMGKGVVYCLLLGVRNGCLFFIDNGNIYNPYITISPAHKAHISHQFPLCLLPLLPIRRYNIQIMDHPFLTDHLSQIHQADTLYDSRLSSFSHSHPPQEALFQQQRSFARSVLSGWGIALGELPFSRDNQVTLRCIVQLVSHRQKDLQFRSRVKDDLSAMQFQRDKFRSFAEQAQRTAQEHLRKVGMLENELNGLRTKGKKGEALIRKQREEDRKVIAGLRAKNEQALHEVKKKQAEAARVRQQMKKSVGEKSMTANKSSFQVFLPLKAPGKEEQMDKYAFLLERNQRELSLAVKENSLLREKLFQIRELLVKFNAWIDRQIFGQQVQDSPEPPRAYNNKFYLNHNLLFKKESLTDQFAALLETTKDGLIQLREIARGNRSPPRVERIEEEELNFRKKPSRREIKTDRVIGLQGENRGNKTSITKRAQGSAERGHQSPRSIKLLPQQQIPSEINIKPLKNIGKSDGGKKVGTVVSRPLGNASNMSKSQNPNKQQSGGHVPFEDDLLSQVNSGHDSSIISHISIQQMGKSRFDKWDILYQEE